MFVFANIRAPFGFLFVPLCGCAVKSLRRGPPHSNAPSSFDLWVLFGADESSHLSWDSSGHIGHHGLQIQEGLFPFDSIVP